MIYISAQSDDLYFLWQLEVQLENFKTNNISPDCIHVLIGYDPVVGLRKEFKNLIRRNKNALFFAYPFLRGKRKYTSVVRPNILKQHFKKFRNLENETFFYHDCDIIFRERIDETMLQAGPQWYVSDTNSYISASYLKSFDQEVIEKMCALVGIPQDKVEQNDRNAGGAQYVMKGVTWMFWRKVEKDCEKIFNYLTVYNAQQKQKKHVQLWCADMWAVLWNALLLNKEIIIHKELDFCWPKENIRRWYETKIFHNAGVVSSDINNIFYKGLYTHFSPFFADFSAIDSTKCTIKFVEAVERYSKTIKKIALTDTTFILPIRIDSTDRLENLYLTTRMISKSFQTNILIVEADDISRINTQRIVQGVKHLFVEDRNAVLNISKYLNIGISSAETSIVFLCDADILIPPKQIEKAVKNIRTQNSLLSYAFDGSYLNLDRNFTLEFRLILDFLWIFERVKGSPKSYNPHMRCCAVNKKHYLLYGGENEKIPFSRHANIERTKRLQILNHKISYVKGSVFHIDHVKLKQLFFPENNCFINSYREYLKICNSKKDDLAKNIGLPH